MEDISKAPAALCMATVWATNFFCLHLKLAGQPSVCGAEANC